MIRVVSPEGASVDEPLFAANYASLRRLADLGKSEGKVKLVALQRIIVKVTDIAIIEVGLGE